jgi:hypothetical protein
VRLGKYPEWSQKGQQQQVHAAKMTDNCPLVLIRRLDSRQPCAAWRYLADVGEPKAVECATVGWLLKDNADVKVVCQSVGDLGDPENAQASGVMAIPARCVIASERARPRERDFPPFFEKTFVSRVNLRMCMRIVRLLRSTRCGAD